MNCCKTFKGLVCGMAVVAAMSLPALAQDKKPTTAQPPKAYEPAKQPGVKGEMPVPTPQQEACAKLGEKNENHARLAQFEGTWSANCKCWESDSEAPMESTGVMTNTIIHDGRFVQHQFKGEFDMGGMKMPFNGTGICGYNNATKQYESSWCDSMGTCQMLMTGNYDDATKTFSLACETYMPDKTGKIVKCKFRETLKIASPDKQVQEFYSTLPGEKETKCMEITYTRGAKTMGKPTTSAEPKPTR